MAIKIVKWDPRDLEGLPSHVLMDVALNRRRQVAVEYRFANRMKVHSTIIYEM